ncbi:MAG TPA: MOSC domain-containing protein [Bryobacteraceae bacterium]|nr:MOSC domain-containing protein [Bryobacteraceae bacterium]
MTVVSINVGKPARVPTANGDVLTSIFKTPVTGTRRVDRLNIEGDQQSDLRVHGGIHKAVYVYPSEHYEYWREQLPDETMPWGMFGENLTTTGLIESDVCIGDRLRVGSAVLQVTQPRMPCFKLALRFGRPDMVKRFWKSGRSGFYVSVIEEGVLEPGSTIERIPTTEPLITVAELVRLYRDPDPPRERILTALETSLAGSWKTEFRERLALLNNPT